MAHICYCLADKIWCFACAQGLWISFQIEETETLGNGSIYLGSSQGPTFRWHLNDSEKCRLPLSRLAMGQHAITATHSSIRARIASSREQSYAGVPIIQGLVDIDLPLEEVEDAVSCIRRHPASCRIAGPPVSTYHGLIKMSGEPEHEIMSASSIYTNGEG